MIGTAAQASQSSKPQTQPLCRKMIQLIQTIMVIRPRSSSVLQDSALRTTGKTNLSLQGRMSMRIVHIHTLPQPSPWWGDKINILSGGIVVKVVLLSQGLPIHDNPRDQPTINSCSHLQTLTKYTTGPSSSV